MKRHCYGGLLAGLLLLATVPASGVDAPAGDTRQQVTMPETVRERLRADMLDHLLALNEIFALLADNKLKDAGALAETRLGVSSMGKYRGTGMGPGRFMPAEMHSIGIGMHQAASEFAKAAESGDAAASYGHLQKITSACVACHMAYRTR